MFSSLLLCLSLSLPSDPSPIKDSPYPFELNRGWIVEPVIAGYNSLDKEDPASYIGGVRISGLMPDATDAVITMELEYLADVIFTGKGQTPRTRQKGSVGLVFYEIYNPFALRVAMGFGAEKKFSRYSPQIYLRGGLGYYFNSYVGLYADYSGRSIFRESKFTFNSELTTALQFIF